MYRYCDLILESALPLSELPRAPGDSRRPDCRFLVDPGSGPAGPPAQWQHQWREPDGRVSLRWARQDGWHWLGFPGSASFAVAADGGLIHGRAGPGVSTAMVRHLLLDQVLPRLLAARGQWVLHAGAVLTSAGVCGFLGRSGAGKSTLCAALAARGCELLGDDGLVLSATSAGLEARPTYRGMRLPPGSIERFFGTAARASVLHPTGKMSLEPAAPTARPGPHPVARLYVLDAPAGRPVSIAPLAPRDGFAALLRNSFQLEPAGREQARRLLEHGADLASRLPLHRLGYARTYGLLPAVCDAVLADLDRRYSPSTRGG